MSNSIISTGSYTTDEILDNKALSKMVDTNDDWIVSRTGIKTRHISNDMTTEELAYKASINALKKASISVDEIGVIIFATVTSDTKVPSSAFRLSGMLGVEGAICFDVNAACSGFVYSCMIADSILKASDKKYALVVGAERLSKIVDFTDRSTCVLFGDGAGCAIIQKDLQDMEYLNMKYQIVDTLVGGEYDKNGYLSVAAKKKVDDEVKEYISMNGKRVYKFATETGSSVIIDILKRNNVMPEDIDIVIPHQANIRIIRTMAEKSGIDIDKWYVNVSEYGNTSSASVPMAMDEALRKVEMVRGGYILLIAFGGGLSYGATLLKVL